MRWRRFDASSKTCRLVFIGGRSNSVDDSEDGRYLRDLDERIHRLNLEDAVQLDRLPAGLPSRHLLPTPSI